MELLRGWVVWGFISDCLMWTVADETSCNDEQFDMWTLLRCCLVTCCVVCVQTLTGLGERTAEARSCRKRGVATQVVTASQSCNGVVLTARVLGPVNETRDRGWCSFQWAKDCAGARPVASVSSGGLILVGEESTTRGQGCRCVERQDRRGRRCREQAVSAGGPV